MLITTEVLDTVEATTTVTARGYRRAIEATSDPGVAEYLARNLREL